jgi:uncharacterized protein with HEPN domain
MANDALKFLEDVRSAAGDIERFCAGRSFGEYVEDSLLRAAVERKFIVIGEALNQLARVDSEMLNEISEHRRIIGFRNLLVHGYDSIGDDVVWDIVQSKLRDLVEEVTRLLP